MISVYSFIFFSNFVLNLSRFWTRNRPGDTVVDKNEEMPTQRLQPSSGIIFKNLDLAPEVDKTTSSDATIVLPGLGLDPELLDVLKKGTTQLTHELLISLLQI